MNILPEQATNHKVSLAEILQSRESRQKRQQNWLASCQTTIISLTMVVPGEVKDSTIARRAFNLAWQALETLCRARGWQVINREVFCLPTGPEGLLAVNQPADVVKQACVECEQHSPIGRLWDIDVISERGIISRQAIGMAPRQCFVCQRDARICARERAHSIPALHDAMEALFHDAEIN
ncbi:2'-(5''-triphosphoribosyl)-3'-dephospho-CoA:apo-citrate lyase [Pragia fontium]|uniref:citrate lyase holo-[acyl-carrier protein] synthase n=1 Tax=Pragia fontium TaxID=82985 RepID=UPI000DFD3D88|nr:citrate lyase holo-[acyl-carrier protein] synthase [Pragia fontium]SUB83712.1 2'-(5''-triphosphoribosyl)-3'-dephospho-CoA:apo-citrate lyase [Pragia fontium]